MFDRPQQAYLLLDEQRLANLSEVYDMLAENVETWTDQWKQQGLSPDGDAWLTQLKRVH